MRLVDQVYSGMLGRRQHFAVVKLDLIQNPEDLDVFYQLNSSSRTRFASMYGEDKQTLAHRLVLSVSLHSTAARALGTIPIPSVRAELVPDEQAGLRLELPGVTGPFTTAAETSQGTASRAALPARARQEAAAAGYDERAEVFVVLRKPGVPAE